MRALIVGCGYVGLPLGAELVRQGHEVWGLRRTRTAEAELISAGITPVICDITQAETLSCLPTKLDWVVLCASASGGGADEYRRVYLDGTRNLLAALANEPPKTWVYTSSTGVYGQTDGSTVDESSPTTPDTETAQVLVEAEQVLLDATREDQARAVLLRVAGICGPGRGYWLKQYLRGEARLEGKGERLLNMIHREDLIGVIIAALERAAPGQVYNAADNEPVTQRACFQWLSERLKRDFPPSMPEESGQPRRRGATHKRVSNRKLRAELGYNFKFPTFREGFEAELQRLGNRE